MGGAVFPPWWLFWPGVSQHWSLQAIGSPGLVSKCWPPLGSPGDSPRPTGRSGPGSYEVTAFSLALGAHMTLCAPSKSGVSVYSSPVELLCLSPTGLQSQMLWGLLLLMPDPWAWEPDMRLRTLTPVGDFLWYNCSPVSSFPPGWYEIWLYCVSLPLYCWLSSFMSLDVEYLFHWVPVVA